VPLLSASLHVAPAVEKLTPRLPIFVPAPVSGSRSSSASMFTSIPKRPVVLFAVMPGIDMKPVGPTTVTLQVHGSMLSIATPREANSVPLREKVVDG
jgi:hypothetical protein